MRLLQFSLNILN